MRNPKDHIIAYYYQHRFKGVQLSLDDFIDLYLTGYLLYGNYFDHVLSFWQLAQLYPENVFFVTYEELKMVRRERIVNSIQAFFHLDPAGCGSNDQRVSLALANHKRDQ